jgi:hypothetical protein
MQVNVLGVSSETLQLPTKTSPSNPLEEVFPAPLPNLAHPDDKSRRTSKTKTLLRWRIVDKNRLQSAGQGCGLEGGDFAVNFLGVCPTRI